LVPIFDRTRVTEIQFEFKSRKVLISQGRVAFLQIDALYQKSSKKVYPKSLNSIGEHLKKRRFDLNLRRVDVATALNVDEE